MKIHPSSNFVTICFLCVISFLVQHIFLNGLYDDGNFLFSDKGDDYNYVNNFKYINSEEVRLIGLAILGQITPYNYFLYLTLDLFNKYFYWFIELTLLIVSNYYFYNIARTCLNRKNANIALGILLILPLRYLWLFSFYKDSILLSVSIIFIYQQYFKKNFSGFLFGSFVFMIRPLSASLILIATQIQKINPKSLLVLFVCFASLYYVMFDYLYFFSDKRISIITDKLTILPLNSDGQLTLLYLPILSLFTILQPTFRFVNDPTVWSNISTVVQVDAILKFWLVPLLIQGFANVRTYLNDKRIRIILMLLIVLSVPITLGFLFLTNRHILIFLPWQIIFALYVYQTKGYNLMILFVSLTLIIGINYLNL